jgi:L-lactate utilization protein LutB
MIFEKKKPEDLPVEEYAEIPEKVEPEEKVKPKEETSFAPLFIKLDRYKEIINKIESIKSTLAGLKSSLSILKDLEKLRDDNIKVIESIISKLEKRLEELDSEFTQPGGALAHMKEIKDVESLVSNLTEIKGQIERMKTENI